MRSRKQFSHPQGVAFIAWTQLWESFSFFGMRALLLLYLISEGYDYKDAVIIYTLYIASVKICAAAGGYVVDRYLGYYRSILLGGAWITTGHLLLSFSSSSSLFFLGLGSIICGSGLFRVSLQASLGLFYKDNDPGREKGFTLFYVGMNLGGLLAAVFCGFVAQAYGWHAGFGLAALGMICGLTLFLLNRKLFYAKEPVSHKRRTSFSKAVPLSCGSIALLALFLSAFQMMQYLALPAALIGLGALILILRKKLNKKVLFSLAGALLLLISFSTVEELWGSLLMVFSEQEISRTLFGLEIPSSALAAINPLTIILVGPLLSKLRVGYSTKLTFAFLALTSAFALLYLASLYFSVSLFFLAAGLSAIALGELLLVPSIYSFASEHSKEGTGGMMMGTTTVALALGSLLSGEVAKIDLSPGSIFLWIGGSCFAIFLILFLKERREAERLDYTKGNYSE